DGLETFQELREQENGLCRDSAVLALTGNTQSGAKQMYLDMGFDGYLEKPIQGKMLEAEILKFLPEDIIENRRDTDGVSGQFGRVQKQSRRKRKKIYVTTDCASDIPQDLLEKYDIKLMYLYIKTPNGRFADTREIDIDSLSQYVSDESSSAYADSVTVEEFEQFFAETLTEADQIIHISLASRAGKSYDIAMTAAKSFDHVHIIDSGQISGGQALVTLHAAMLAMEGKSAKEIIKEVESGLGNIHTRVIMAGAEIFHQNGRARSATVKVCRFLNLHPYMAMLQKRAVLIALLGGSMENAWRQGIRLHLRRKRKISRGICFVTHVGCSVKQQEWIKKEILKCIPFERVVMQKASFTNACNTGKNAIGIAYYTFPK
ncbi:MAG: DegV family EDD domain-containing protein, partial [Lachnospiraceae bacterium]|nr:DegV family EDD domain-containing protein [Lachnospiraceae bacterium]